MLNVEWRMLNVELGALALGASHSTFEIQRDPTRRSASHSTFNIHHSTFNIASKTMALLA
jgi:hypothetical protein